MDAEDGLAQPLLARGPSAPRPPPSASAPLAVPLLSGDGDDPPVAVLPAQAPLPWPAQLRRLLCEDADELAAFARLASVCALLLAGFGVARAAAALGAPPDACAERSDGGALAFDFAQLLQLGALLCWLNGLTTPRRFAWAASSHSVAPLFLVVCALFGALDRVPGLQVSLADIPAWGVTAWACMLAAGAAAAAAVAWHARLAREQLLPRAWLAYLGSRCCVCGAYVALWLTMRLSPAGRQRWVATHLHHWAVGFLLAIWGNFNADASGALLAVGAGLMTQGISAYGASWIFYTTPAGLRHAALQAGCAGAEVVAAAGGANSSAWGAEVVCRWRGGDSAHGWGVQACPVGYGGGPRPAGSCEVVALR